MEFDGAVYYVFRLERARHVDLQLLWLGKDGKPLGSFTGLRDQVESEGRHIRFAMNAGIYAMGPKPVGLTICGGHEDVPLNLASGEGNFFLQPNGVFYLDDKSGPGVMESGEFSRSGINPRLATQSGPLLLRRGVIHPAFNVGSPNRRLRNGVGVRASDGQIIFAISDRNDRERGRVTFHQMARFFLQQGCQDALYLDGDVSDILVDPAPETKLTPNTFAAMFVVLK